MEERPRSGLEFLVCALSGALLLGLAGWLLHRVTGSYETFMLIGAVCLAAIGGYLAYVAWELHTCRYRLDDGKLVLQQGLSRVEVDLAHVTGLHRWKPRWMWFHSLRADLGLQQVDLYPPLSFFREHSTWVVTYTGEDAEERGVAFRPSPRLLNHLRRPATTRNEAING